MRPEKSVRFRARAEALVGALDAGFLKQNGFLLSCGGTPLTLIGSGFWGNAIRNTAVLQSDSSQKAPRHLSLASLRFIFPFRRVHTRATARPGLGSPLPHWRLVRRLQAMRPPLRSYHAPLVRRSALQRADGGFVGLEGEDQTASCLASRCAFSFGSSATTLSTHIEPGYAHTKGSAGLFPSSAW